MIPGPALATWIADRDAQKSSQARVDACVGKWSAHPLMTQVEREIFDLPRQTPEALIAVARRFLDRSGDIEAMMREFIATSRIDPFFRPPLSPITHGIFNSLLLYHHAELSIALGVTSVATLAAKKSGRSGAASINFAGHVMLLRFIKAGGAILSFWEAPPITATFEAARAGRCRLVERREIADGEEIVIDGRHQSFVIDHATSDMVYYQAVARGESAPVCAEYDADTLEFVGASSTDEVSSRIQMMTSLLRAMGRDEALPLLAESLDGWHFHTRWHIMREMLAMDAEAALPSLRRMAETDPHPDIRAAARQTLDLFFPDTPAAGEEAVSCRA